MSQPPLNVLRAIEAVTRTGSFRAAALCITKEGVNRRVTYLD